jgi:manganese oxidase
LANRPPSASIAGSDGSEVRMLMLPIDYVLLVWFVLAGLSAAYVAYDQYANNPEPVVMKWGFILVTAYMGPIGVILYVLADKEPAAGTHESFIAPLWKQGVGSTIHCVAGDATGIILAATITAALGLPMWLDLIVEYIAGFAFGLLIFQALFMKDMMGGTYWQNVRRSFLPEFTSMNAMMAAMAPVMSLLMMGRDMRAMVPSELLFWGVMSVGVIAGYAVAYPVNVWLVASGLKHGLMTERPTGSRFDLAPKQRAKPAARKPAHGMAAMAPGMTMPAGKKSGAGGTGGAHAMTSGVTVPQLAAVAGMTTILLIAGMVFPAFFVNLSLSARDVGGAIMPPGMIMTYDTPGASMRDMAAINPRLVSYTASASAQGDQVLAPRIESGVKIFELEASVIRWTILPGLTVDAYAFNHQVPGPRLRLAAGDRVRINFRNNLPESTTIHWHGLILPNAMDGPAEITQPPVKPGESFTYEFTATQTGTYFYHSHDHPDRQQALGLYGALIIDPQNRADEPRADLEYTIQLQEWLHRETLTYPAMIMEGSLPNYFTINGKSYPATDVIRMRVGQTVKLRFIGSNNNFIHPMHVHGGAFQVVARDGEILPPGARFLADTINVGPGQRYDVIWTARLPGKWLLHCHIPHHTTNNNVEDKGGGGLTMVIEVQA